MIVRIGLAPAGFTVMCRRERTCSALRALPVPKATARTGSKRRPPRMPRLPLSVGVTSTTALHSSRTECERASSQPTQLSTRSRNCLGFPPTTLVRSSPSLTTSGMGGPRSMTSRTSSRIMSPGSAPALRGTVNPPPDRGALRGPRPRVAGPRLRFYDQTQSNLHPWTNSYW